MGLFQIAKEQGLYFKDQCIKGMSKSTFALLMVEKKIAASGVWFKKVVLGLLNESWVCFGHNMH